MKRNFWVILVVAVLITGYACTHDKSEASKVEIQTSQAAFEDLNEQLSLIYANYGTGPQTRGFWKFLKRFFLGDIMGAFMGGAMTWSPYGALGGAIMGSFGGAIYHNNQQGTESSVTIRPDLDYVYSLTDPSLGQADSLGILHNKIISDIFLECGDIYSLDPSILKDLVIDKVENYSEIPEEEKELMDDFSLELEAILGDEAEYDEIAFQRVIYRLMDRFPNRHYEIEILRDYCINLQYQNPDNRDLLTGTITDTVNSSDIPDDSKNIINDAINIGFNSDILWIEGDFDPDAVIVVN